MTSNGVSIAIDDKAASREEEKYMPTLSCYKKLGELKPWFENIRRSVVESSKNKNDLDSLRIKLPGGAKLSLKLGLTMEGNLDRLSILRSSGLEAEDHRELHIISQSVPFMRPPNDLIEQGVLIEIQFLKTDSGLDVKVYPILPSDFSKPKHP